MISKFTINNFIKYYKNILLNFNSYTIDPKIAYGRINIFVFFIFLFFSILWVYTNQLNTAQLGFIYTLLYFINFILLYFNKYYKLAKNILFFLSFYFVNQSLVLYGDLYPNLIIWEAVLLIFAFIYYNKIFFLVNSFIIILIVFNKPYLKNFLLKNNYIFYEKAEFVPWLDHLQTIPFLAIIYYLVNQHTLNMSYKNKILDDSNKQLVLIRQKLEESEKFKTKFYAQISHEIRTPLNAIKGLTYILKKTSLDIEQKKLVETISQSTENLTILLNDIIEISKLELGVNLIKKNTFDLRKELQYIQNISNSLIYKKNILFSLQIHQNTPNFLIGDANRLKQVLINIIHNSIKFTEKGTVSLNITYQMLDPKKCRIKFEIKDTGIGINEENINKIFEEYFKNDSSYTSEIGAGIGLYIVKKFIDLMNGFIQVQSIEGKGTSFIVELPFEISESNKEIKSIKILNENNSKLLLNKHFLVVDDHKTNLFILSKIIEDLGAKVSQASNGIEAIEKFKQINNFDYILMDISMPIMDGFETSKILRFEYKTKIPIIGVTANSLNETKLKAIESGMSAVILKPIQIDELLTFLFSSVQNE